MTSQATPLSSPSGNSRPGGHPGCRPDDCGTQARKRGLSSTRRYAAALLRTLPIVALVITLFGCATDRITREETEAQPQRHAARQLQAHTSPEAQGIDSRDLVEVLERARHGNIDLHSLIVARRGMIVAQLYVPPYGPDTLHNVKSVTKSVLSALTGVAVERGCFKGIDTPVAELLPEDFRQVADPRKRDITVRHLLTMTAGLDLDENGPKLARIMASDDWVRATLAQPLVANPGETFLYTSPLSHLLGKALSTSCGTNLLALCRSSVCGALDIERLAWRRTPGGDYFGAADLYLAPRDMLKFGMLYLDEGRYDGRQVIPREWVHESTRDQVAGITGRKTYGFGWWPVEHGYKATGWGGQRIWIVPKRDLVIVATMAAHDGFETMFDGFDPDRLSDHPLPENREAANALAAELAEWRKPAPHGPVAEMAKTVDGKVFIVDFASTTSRLHSLAFAFPAGAEAQLTIRTQNKTDVLAVGLDGRYRTSPTTVFSLNDDGQAALRGHWSAPNRFDFELLPLGEPARLILSATFTGDSMTLTGTALPEHKHLSLNAYRQGDGKATGAGSQPRHDIHVPPIGVLEAPVVRHRATR